MSPFPFIMLGLFFLTFYIIIKMGESVDRSSAIVKNNQANKIYNDCISKYGSKDNWYRKEIIFIFDKEDEKYGMKIPATWKKVLIKDVSYYPLLICDVIDQDKKSTGINNEINSEIKIDLRSNNLVKSVSLKEFETIFYKLRRFQKMDEVRLEIKKLNILKERYAYENLIWNKYYGGMPLEYCDTMSGIDFEKFVQNLLIKKGYDVVRTKSTGDQGVDLIAQDSLKKRIAIQTKRYTTKVGNKAIQEVVAGRKYHKCVEAWVITNSNFTTSAKDLAKVNRVRLIDGAELISAFSDAKTVKYSIPEFDESRYAEIKVIAEKKITQQRVTSLKIFLHLSMVI